MKGRRGGRAADGALEDRTELEITLSRGIRLEANRENRFDCKRAPAKAKVQSERQEPAQWEG